MVIVRSNLEIEYCAMGNIKYELSWLKYIPQKLPNSETSLMNLLCDKELLLFYFFASLLVRLVGLLVRHITCSLIGLQELGF